MEEVGASEKWSREHKAEGERGKMSAPNRPAPHGAKREVFSQEIPQACPGQGITPQNLSEDGHSSTLMARVDFDLKVADTRF